MIAEKRRKRTVARFVALTTSAAADDCSTVAAKSNLISQTLDQIIRVVTNMEEELLTEYKPKILTLGR